jgi:NAD(P)-dependent dehydrogenase (short-subunit alcohol dehydrogenase family)
MFHTLHPAISETLAVEIAPFSIRVLIVEPGSFRTEGIYSNPAFEDNPISSYDDMRRKVYARHAYYGVNGAGVGDPAKAMDVLVGVVNGEGMAKGKPWPLYLVLGRDAEHDVRQKCAKMVKVLDEWMDMAQCADTDYNPKSNL